MVENFMNKLAEKIGSQDIIKANLQAEAAETERLRQESERIRLEAEQYKAQMEEMKKVAEEYRAIIEEMRHDSGEFKTQLEQMKEDTVQFRQKLEDSETKIHDIGVQVYRNVQAVVEKEQLKNKVEFGDIAKKLEAIQVVAETKNNGVLPLVIITMLLALGDLVINVLQFLGIVW